MKKNGILVITLLLMALVQLSAQKAPTAQWFLLQSAVEAGNSSGGYFDVPGKPTSIGSNEIQNLTVWDIDGGIDRQYQVVNVKDDKYEIYTGHSVKTHVVKMEETFKKNGANFQIEKRIDGGEKDIFNRQLFTFIYQGAGKWKIYSDDGRIVCLDGRSSKDGTNIHLWEDHDGLWTEWVFISPKTKAIIYPDIAKNLNHISDGGKIKNSVSKETAKAIDETYLKLYAAERELFNYLANIRKSKSIIDRTSHFSGKMDKLDIEVGRLEGIISAFNKIPVIGPATVVLSKGVGMISSPLGKTNIAISKTDEKIVSPAKSSVDNAMESIVDYEKEFIRLMYQLEKMKEIYLTAAMAIEDDQNALIPFNQNSSKLIRVLEAIPIEMGIIKDEISQIDKMTKNLSKIESTVNTLDKGITNFEKVFHEIDKVGKEVDKVLSAELDAKVVKVSIMKVLNGFSIPKVARDKVNKWTNKLVDPLIKKLNIKIPKVPGVDKFNKEINSIVDKIELVEKSSLNLNKCSEKIPLISAGLEAPFLGCLQAVPYDKMVKYRLVQKSEY